MTFMLSDAVTLTDKIGEGGIREVFRDGDCAVKVIKPFRRKSYGLFSINWPTELYVLLNYGIRDFNKFEFDAYVKLMSDVPDEFVRNFAAIYTARRVSGRNISVQQLVSDVDGAVSPSLARHGAVGDKGFWRELDSLVDLFLGMSIPYFDLHAENFVVQDSGDGLHPVVIDYKRVGARNIFRWSGNGDSKIIRRYAKLRQDYMV